MAFLLPIAEGSAAGSAVVEDDLNDFFTICRPGGAGGAFLLVLRALARVGACRVGGK